jgi:hypothetical protein
MAFNVSRDPRIEMNKITPFDILLIGAILIFSTGFIAKTKFIRETTSFADTQAVIFCEGKEIQRMNLLKNTELTLPGGKMTIAVEKGKVRVKQSNCLRQTCVHSGWIHSPGEAIICIPNKTVIEISNGNAPLIDAVAF